MLVPSPGPETAIYAACLSDQAVRIPALWMAAKTLLVRTKLYGKTGLQLFLGSRSSLSGSIALAWPSVPPPLRWDWSMSMPFSYSVLVPTSFGHKPGRTALRVFTFGGESEG